MIIQYIVNYNDKIVYLKTRKIVNAILIDQPQAIIKRIIV
jgi:hypothetical protein